MNKKLVQDIAERSAWTLAQVLVAYGIANQASLPTEYVIYITPLLAVLKGVVAKHFGDPNSASLDPFTKKVAEEILATVVTPTVSKPAPVKKAVPSKKAASAPAPVKKTATAKAPAKKAPAKKPTK